MPAHSIERTRRLIDAAVSSGIISNDEERAVTRALAGGELEPHRLEAALVSLVGQLEVTKRDLRARKQAFARFFDRLDSRGRPGGRDGGANADEERMGMTEGTSQARPVLQWGGNLGRVIGPNAEYGRGVPEPTYFAKDLAHRDSMVLTAEAYVPGVTDQLSASLDTVSVEVLTDLGGEPGVLRTLELGGATDGRRANNNIRVHWNVAPLVARAAPGRYGYQFRFSADGGATWVQVPEAPQHLIVAGTLDEVPPPALVESSLLFKVGEVSPARIGWLGPPTVRTGRDQPGQPLPAEVTFDETSGVEGRVFLELAVQVWAPGVSNRADLTPDEHSLALEQLGVRVESAFFHGGGTLGLGFAGKAGIHEHDDIARFNLVQYLEELRARGVETPATGDYHFEVLAGDKHLGTLVLHWVRAG